MKKIGTISLIIAFGAIFILPNFSSAAEPLVGCSNIVSTFAKYAWCQETQSKKCQSYGLTDLTQIDVLQGQGIDSFCQTYSDQKLGSFKGVGCTVNQAPPDLCVSAAAARAGGGIGCCMTKYAGNRKCTEVSGSNEKDICIKASTATTLATIVPTLAVFGVVDFSDVLGVEYADTTACATIPECPQYVAASKPLFVPDWTGPDCVKAGGEWLPDAGKTSGKFCYAKQDINYTPQISIGGGKIDNLGDYVAKAYNYALGFVMMIAIIMVMVGGVQWIMARGGGGVEAAKKRIGNAVLGLVLLFCAYLILNTISPAIVKLSLPRVPMLKQNKFAFSEVANCGGYKDKTTCEQNAVGMNKGWSCYAPQGTTSAGCKWDTASSACVMAPPALSGALYSQCPDGKCNDGLFCATVLATGNCKICSDGKRGSPCNEDANCTESGYNTCDKNIKQCRGDKMRPIGSDCDKDEQCAGGPCDKAICKSTAILNKEGILPCPPDKFEYRGLYSPTLIMKLQRDYPNLATTVQDCKPLGEAGASCWLSGECKSGSCSMDNINRNATNVNDVKNGLCQ